MQSLAIIPFKHDKDLVFLATGLQSYLNREFGKDEAFKTISPSSTAQFGFDNEKELIGKRLNCDLLIFAELQQRPEHVEIGLQLFDVKKSMTRWKTLVRVSPDQVIELGPICFEKIKQQLSGSPVNFNKTAQRPILNAAYEKFLQGKHFFNRWSEQDALEAQVLFEQVIDLEPEFTPAYNWLAKVLIFQAGRGYRLPEEVYPQAEELIDQSLLIKPQSGEALIYKGLIEFFFHLNWEACYTHIEQGLRYYIDASEAYQQLSLFWYGIKAYHEALSALQTALEYDPLSAGILNMMGDVLMSQGNLDQAERVFKSILRLNPNDSTSLENLGFLYTLRGEQDKAMIYLKRFRKRLPHSESVSPRLAYAYGKFGLGPEIDETVKAYERLSQQHPNKLYHNALSNLHAGMEDWNTVRELITTSWHKRAGILYIVTDPVLEPIRSKAWYKSLLGQIKYPGQVGGKNYIGLNTELKEAVHLDTNALIYLKADNQYVEAYVYRNFRVEKQLIRQRLEKLLAQLPSHFLQVHRSYVINANVHFEHSGNARGMVLTSKKHGISIPVSRTQIPTVKAKLN